MAFERKVAARAPRTQPYSSAQPASPPKPGFTALTSTGTMPQSVRETVLEGTETTAEVRVRTELTA